MGSQFCSVSRRGLRTFPVVLLLAATLVGCTDARFLFSGLDLPFNLHELDPGKAYRSAQPTGFELENAIDLLDLKTVINLRGYHAGDPWYDEEAQICQEMGVTLVDFRMSGRSLPEPELLEAIVETLQTAQYPILIHCLGGADRTGGVSAVYRMLIAGDDRATAMQQLSPSFLHFPIRYPCMDYLAQIYESTDEWLIEYAENYDQYQCGYE